MGKKPETPPPIEATLKFPSKQEGLDIGVSSKGSMIAALIASAVAAIVLFVVLYDPPAPDAYGHRGWAGWSILGYAVLSLLLVMVAAGVFFGIASLVRIALAEWHEYEQTKARDALNLAAQATQNGHDATRAEIEASHLANLTGRMGAIVKPTANGWQVINLDAEKRPLLLRPDGSTETIDDDPFTRRQIAALHELDVERARAAQYPQLQTYHNQQQMGDVGARADAAEVDPTALPWPVRVPLRDLLSGPPSLHRLALGVTIDPETRLAKPLHADLGQMVHVAVGGSSGWGKSVFLRALAFQLATADEDCRLALIDLEAVTFAPFANSDRLLWPVADTDGQALAIAEELMVEMNRRKELYRQYPGVDNLAAYNRQSPELLLPWVCLVDEAPALMSGDVESAFRELARRARKFGLWLVLGSQGWRTEDIDSSIRDMLSACVQFRAKTASQSRVLLGDSGAVELGAQGRALALLPGQPLTMIQAPMVEDGEIRSALAQQTGPIFPAPPEVAILPAGVSHEQAEMIHRLAELGKSRREIEERVFGHSGGAAYRKVRDVLALGGWADVEIEE